MPSSVTTKYTLNQWARSDQVRMEDFNADNEKIDAALARKAESETLTALQGQVNTVQDSVLRIAAGSYTGNGASRQTISLAFTPKAVFVCGKNGRIFHSNTFYDFYYYGGLAVTGSSVVDEDGHTVLSITSGGFQVYCANSSSDKTTQHHTLSNSAGTTYHYLAFG